MSDRNDEERLSFKGGASEALLRRILLAGAAAEFGTPYGQMRMRGELTASQYAACRWFDGLYERYLAAIGRSRGMRTSTGERVEASHPLDPFSPIGWDRAIIESQDVKKFDYARMAAMACGQDRFRSFWAAVIDGLEVMGHQDKKAVSDVASALERHRSRGWVSRRKK